MFFKGPGESFEYFDLKDITHANNLAKKYEAASENPTRELHGFSARFEPKITNSQVSVPLGKRGYKSIEWLEDLFLHPPIKHP